MAATIESFVEANNQLELNSTELAELVIQRQEGILASSGAIVVRTGNRTGRSPADRFIVRNAQTELTVDWGTVNQPIDIVVFEKLWRRVEAHLDQTGSLVSDLHVGAHPKHYLPINVQTEFAWHAMFARAMFIVPEEFNPAKKPIWQVMSAPGFTCNRLRDGTNSDATVMIDFESQRVLLVGMRYAGELKKAMFSVQNFLLTDDDVLPMHCSANVDENDEVALFFGLSGTGKTTLSADESCLLIGDDEHGWGPGTVFNLEGGCYAKCIDLKRETEPVIFDAIRFGAIVENVVVDEDSREVDYADPRYTENTRACYPRRNIAKRVEANRAGEPSVILFLTCDVSGVIPPVSILSKQAAAYHFLSGYTARVGSTEVGSTEDYAATFSACFGEAFFPRPPQVYADLLMRRMATFGTRVYLINTGWTGGGHKTGKRFAIPVTRAIVQAARQGLIDDSNVELLEGLNLKIPKSVEGIDAEILNPRNTWSDKKAYDRAASALIEQFQTNFERFDVDPAISTAGPSL